MFIGRCAEAGEQAAEAAVDGADGDVEQAGHRGHAAGVNQVLGEEQAVVAAKLAELLFDGFGKGERVERCGGRTGAVVGRVIGAGDAFARAFAGGSASVAAEAVYGCGVNAASHPAVEGELRVGGRVGGVVDAAREIRRRPDEPQEGVLGDVERERLVAAGEPACERDGAVEPVAVEPVEGVVVAGTQRENERGVVGWRVATPSAGAEAGSRGGVIRCWLADGHGVPAGAGEAGAGVGGLVRAGGSPREGNCCIVESRSDRSRASSSLMSFMA